MLRTFSDAVGPKDADRIGQERESTALSVGHMCEDGKRYWFRRVRVIEKVVYTGADQYGPMVYEWRVVRWLGA